MADARRDKGTLTLRERRDPHAARWILTLKPKPSAHGDQDLFPPVCGMPVHGVPRSKADGAATEPLGA